MHDLFIVPRVPLSLPGGITGSRPNFGALTTTIEAREHGWGQAGSKINGGKQATWVRTLDDAERATLAAIPGAKLVHAASAQEIAESDERIAALRTEKAPAPGKAWGPKDESVSYYRGKIAGEEAKAVVVASVLHWLPLLLSTGLGIAFALARIEGLLGPAGVSFALVVLHSDAFTRADATLNGSTMSDGIGAWTNVEDANVPSVISNQCGSTANTNAYKRSYDSVMSAVDVQRSQATRAFGAPDMIAGLLTRYESAGGTGYLAFMRPGTTVGVFTQPAFSSLGSATEPANGQTFAMDSDGNNHSFLANGSVTGGPFSDSSYTTGRAGLLTNDLGAGASNVLMDAWQVEVAGGAGIVKTINGLAYASVKTINGLAVASVKTWNGMATQ